MHPIARTWNLLATRAFFERTHFWLTLLWLRAVLPAIGFALPFLATSTIAQPNVRGHYANGQVWIVWNVQDVVLTNCVPTLTPALSNGVPVILSNCLPATYAIYWSENPVTNTTTGLLIGRLFESEWSGQILRDNVNASFNQRPTGFRIPDGAGGYRTLATNEGLFVHTVRSNFAGHYAVRPFGVTNVPAAWRAPLTNAIFSLADPPTCHLQAQGTNTLSRRMVDLVGRRGHPACGGPGRLSHYGKRPQARHSA
jgi:hypothetical protein